MWETIKGFEMYKVSRDGEVKSLYFGKERILKQWLTAGYNRVCLKKMGERTHKIVHRLVAEAFIPNPENKPCVNHKDGNRQNNNVDNLEWVTYGENHRHAYDELNRVSGNSSEITIINKNGQHILTFSSKSEASRVLGINRRRFANKEKYVLSSDDVCGL